MKVLHGFDLSFGTPQYANPIPGSDLASWVDVRPEATVVRCAHESFTADATWLVPQDQPGGLVLLDIHTSVPLQITVKFRIDLKRGRPRRAEQFRPSARRRGAASPPPSTPATTKGIRTRSV